MIESRRRPRRAARQGSGRSSRGRSGRGRRRLATILIVVTVVAVIAGAAVIWLPRRASTAATGPAAPALPSPDGTPTPTPTPRTAAEALLDASDDPAACAVSFVGDGIADQPMLETQGALYAHLPIPAREGAVFAGWYATPEDAAALAVGQRVNGSKLVVCNAQQVTLYGGWTSPELNAAEDAHIPILMFHQFTTKPEGESGWLRANYAYIGDFEAQMAHIAAGGFYLPTWDELSGFIDGRLFLPDHSVIITDDDADQTWLDLAAPIVQKDSLLTTSFVITAFRQAQPPNPFVLQRSHTNDMHKAGANGKGEMVNLSAEQIAADLQASAAVLGAKEVIAYPYGHYNDTAKQGVVQAGFDMARTIEPGYVTIGTDKLALPVQRINYGMGEKDLARMIG